MAIRRLIQLPTVLLCIAVLASCTPDPAFAPTPTRTPAAAGAHTPTASPIFTEPTPIPTVVPTISATSTAEAEPTPTETTMPEVTATNPPPPPLTDGLPADHYVMIRPIPEGHTTYLDRTYPYGGTAGGTFRPHSGVEFFNPAGTPVKAVADAIVEYAGTDSAVSFSPQAGFYGNLIVLRLTASYQGRPIFALYGHLSEIAIETGQTVTVGQEIGKVGGTGIANGGAHLHFEVRLDDPYNYNNTRNPDLWIKPYGGYGTLAGRIISPDGAYLREASLTIHAEDWPRYTWTYAGDENSPDDAWGENFTYGDLPEGWYKFSIAGSTGKIYREDVYIRAGRTSWLEIVIE